MKSRLVLMATFMVASLTAPARQLWLAPGGSGNGLTEATPAGNALEAIENLVAGDTLWLKGGTYDVDNMIVARRSGTRHHRICVFGYGDGRAVLDFTSAPHNGGDDQSMYRGVLMSTLANYWYWRDVDFTKSPDNGMKLEGSYNVIERCNFYRCGDTGLQLGFDKGDDGENNRNPKYLYGRYNQIINCDSYFNYDVQSSGGNADGFANKMYPGPGNEWHGDRCWNNSDDGWDLYYAAYPCLIEGCWAINNGYLEDGSVGKNGNGFKQGGNKQGGGSYGAHVFLNCVAAYNLYHGFDQNNHNEGNWLLNCTAFANKQVNFRFNCKVDLIGNTVFHLRNCLGFAPGESNHRFYITPDSKYTNWQDILHVSPDYNMGKGTNPETGQEYVRLSSKDWPDYTDQFVDIKLETALGPRQPNGELPLNFARPKPESIFVDKGMPIEDFDCYDIWQDQYELAGDWLESYGRTVTLPYYGEAPDYGAYEAGWERPSFALETLPVNDGTVYEPDQYTQIDGKVYEKQVLIDLYTFQDAVLPDSIMQYVSDAHSSNTLNSNYFGESGSYPTKMGKGYGGATRGAYKVAKNGGYIDFSLPSMSYFVTNVYATGDNCKIQFEYRTPDESSFHEAESFVTDRRIQCMEANAWGIPQTAKPIVVRVKNAGSRDFYLTDLTIHGLQETDSESAVTDLFADGYRFDIQPTLSGLIVYGDIASIEVFDIEGVKVAESRLSQFVNLSHVSDGLFIVKIIAKDGTMATRKILRKS